MPWGLDCELCLCRWTKALQVMHLDLWPLKDGESTYPIPDDVKFGMALPAK